MRDMIFYVFIYIPSTRRRGILSIRILALLKFGGNDYLLAGDDYLPALPWFDNAGLNKRTELTIMKIERTAVIAALSVIVGLGIVGVSPAFATDWNTFNSANSALKSVQDWEYNNGGSTWESQRVKHSLEDTMDRALNTNSSWNE